MLTRWICYFFQVVTFWLDLYHLSLAIFRNCNLLVWVRWFSILLYHCIALSITLTLSYSISIIVIGANKLTGSIPTELAMVRELKIVDIGDNLLAGPIPSEFGTIVALEVMILGKLNWVILRYINVIFDFVYPNSLLSRCVQIKII